MARGARSIKSAIYAASNVLNNIGAGVLLVMMFFICVDVILRNTLNSPILGSYEIVQYMMVIMVFFFFAHAQVEKANVRVTMLISKLPVRARKVVESVTYLIGAIYFVAITVQLIRESHDAFVRGDTSPTLFLPHFPFVFVAGIGAAFMSLVLIIDFIASLGSDIGDSCRSRGDLAKGAG